VVDSASSDYGSSREEAPIGPGHVVLVAGPSGAGKDAVIREVTNRLGSDPRFLFPRRVVTRQSNAAEQHAVLTPAEFEAELRRGGFALHWEAHGLSYGIPADIDEAARAGRCVVFNASRRVVPMARGRYANAAVVLIDAPLELRANRLASRDRERARDIDARLKRVVAEFDAGDVDLVIDNSGSLCQAADALADWLSVRTGRPNGSATSRSLPILIPSSAQIHLHVNGPQHISS
jgi:ribose 1,5-bisphosphokinase